MTMKTILVGFSLLLWNFHNVECTECGVRKVFQSTPLVYGGAPAYAGKWPWFVSLFLKEADQFYCGSSLISEKHLLTGELRIQNN